MQEKGRSMVEMLGVLAIIGVLSVGAISGYSKAMFKYKLNRQAEAMTLLLNNAIQLQPNPPETGLVFYSELLSKLNLLPDGIKLSKVETDYLSDIFDNRIWYFAYPTNYGIGYDLNVSRDGREICQNLINVYKQNADILYSISTDRFYTDDDDESGWGDSNRFYGKDYCSKSDKCIANMTLDDIDTLCNSCLEDSVRCRFYATWQ